MSAALIAVVVSLLLGHLVPSLPLLRRYDWFIGWLHWLGKQTSGDEWPNRVGLLLAVGLPLLVVGARVEGALEVPVRRHLEGDPLTR